MQHPFPVMLDLAGRQCAVFGAGLPAEEKAAALRSAGAAVRLIEDPPCAADLDGVFLAVSTLTDSAVNGMLFAEAKRRGVLFNAIDAPPNCGFYFPAVHRQGQLVVALSTSGHCPALAVRLKERLAGWIGPEYGQFVRLTAGIRSRIRESGLPFRERRRIWYRIVDSPALDLLRAGRQADAEWAIVQILDEELGAPTVDAAAGQSAEARP